MPPTTCGLCHDEKEQFKGQEKDDAPRKPASKTSRCHEVLNPALPDDDFEAAVAIAQAEFDKHQPDVVVGSSRGGAVAMNINAGDTPLVLLCPAWKRWGTVTTVKPSTVILHSRADETLPFADSQELLRNSGLPESALIVVGTDHRLADPEPLKAMLEAVERAGGTRMSDSTVQPTTTTDRITRWLLIAIGVYSALLVGFLNLVILNSDKARDRAIFLMADGMILLWIIVGGSLTPMLRRRLVPRIAAIPIDWRVRFVLFCTAMALIEEVITTTMTNCAPLFGTTPEEAHITASTNYFHVVFFHSVVVFVFMFIAWAWMLSRWDFSPLKVLLLFGITGSLAEATHQPDQPDRRLLGLRLRADGLPARLHRASGSRSKAATVVALPAGGVSAVSWRDPWWPGGHASAKMARRAVPSGRGLIIP